MTSPRFSSLGGDPALDFVNTRPMGESGSVERLPAFADVVRWCVQFGLLAPAAARRLTERGQKQALAESQDLREQFRAALQRQADGKPNWTPLIQVLNTTLARESGVRTLRAERGGLVLAFDQTVASPSDVATLIAGCIASFVTRDDLHLVRRCASDDCVLWFIDRTRNHSRHWCSMAGCGDKAKARAFYRRKKLVPR